MKSARYLIIALFSSILFSCSRPVAITSGNLLLEVNDQLETKLTSTGKNAKPLMNDFSPSEYLSCKKFDAKQFHRIQMKKEVVSDQRGIGQKFILSGEFKQGEYSIRKILQITVYDSFPGMAFFRINYVNTGERDIDVVKWVSNSYPVMCAGDSPSFWTFQGSSSQERKDWILPVDSSFSQENFMGMNNSDYGGGIPVTDIWRKDAGIAIGSAEILPRMISLPVEKDKYDSWAQVSIEYSYPEFLLKKSDTLSTYASFVSVHSGDCFSSLQNYSRFMQASGIKLAPVEPEAYEAVWCAWGYERRFTVDEVLGTLPKVKELGLKWVDIDDGYQQAEGDWDVDPSKFPGGDADMRRMVDHIHTMGLKAKLWWAPLAADPGSKLLRDNPDLLLINKDGVPQVISYWNAYYMSPDYQKTIDHTKAVLKMFLKDWDFDGLKMDGGFLNCVPPDYESEHHLAYPMQSFENLPRFFEMVYNTAESLKPHAVLQICPCGAAMSYFTMPFMNQAVASDPQTSWQTRLKGKTYKALLGKIAYYGDHIELSDNANDFATQIGVGAVLGTKFTWPKDNPYAHEGKFLLTPENEKIWKKWIGIYNQKMLPAGNYRGELYDIGYDKPETHVIQKSDTVYYAFYTKNWDGVIELRGLENKLYSVKDYVNGIEYDQVQGPIAKLAVKFNGSLLLELIPKP